MTTLTIKIPSELDVKVKNGAKRNGVSPNEYIVQAIERGVRLSEVVPHLSSDEAVLLQKINEGLPADTWDEYHNLVSGRDEETLTPRQHARLLEILNLIEVQTHVELGHWRS